MINKLTLLPKIKELYKSGGNIIQFLKEFNHDKKTTFEDILISYDFQAGSYTEIVSNNMDYMNRYSQMIADEIEGLHVNFESIMEVGVGEATTLGNVIQKFKSPIKRSYGFDISWSRIHYGNNYLKSKGISNTHLFMGDLFNIPLADNSIDILYTSHSLEPNGGKEKEALEELYRVANKYIVLLEPGYEFVDDELKKRMDAHGYVKNLVGVASKLGYKVVKNNLFGLGINKLNPPQLIIIEKNKNASSNEAQFNCPITKTKLYQEDNYCYTNDGLLAYPILKNIPCLLPQHAIVATRLNDFN